jgi:hypothetical protein
MPSLISSRQMAGQPTAEAMAWASVVLPDSAGPLTTMSVGSEGIFAFIADPLVNRVLPGPVSRFPFNACLQELRIRRFIGARCGIGGSHRT